MGASPIIITLPLCQRPFGGAGTRGREPNPPPSQSALKDPRSRLGSARHDILLDPDLIVATRLPTVLGVCRAHPSAASQPVV